MKVPKLNLWHKTLLLLVVAMPAAFYAFRTNGRINLKSEGSLPPSSAKPSTFKITNSSSPDSLTQVLGEQLRAFMRKNGLRGGINVAISKGGRLTFAKGFGYADLEDSTLMEPYNVMRVASVSKLVTAVAVMRLVDEGKLFLDQKVFGPVGILNDDIYSVFRDSRMRNITVRHLLNHSGGWATNYGDPMFMPQSIESQMGCGLPVSIEDIIRFIQCKSLNFTPGAFSVYSNFGYGVLGEVVAKAAGMPYEEYVQSQVFYPLGIFDAHLGYSHKEERLVDEVAYYEPDTASLVPDYAEKGKMSRRAYGGSDVHTLGSAGGWVISPVDLLKLMLAIDGFASVPDLISEADINAMTEPNSYLDPLGWRKVIDGFWFRTGTLSATSAALCRRPDGICFAAVLNSSSGSLGPNLAIMLANKMNEQINRIKYWPDTDLWADDTSWNAYKALNGN